jgi:hypothetical protein
LRWGWISLWLEVWILGWFVISCNL